jgi:hypothetical protein
MKGTYESQRGAPAELNSALIEGYYSNDFSNLPRRQQAKSITSALGNFAERRGFSLFCTPSDEQLEAVRYGARPDISIKRPRL